jgi:hypothetical protein
VANQRACSLNNGFVRSKGAILIIILVLSTLIAMLANVAMETGILQIKMANNFRLALQVRKQVEEDIRLIEKKLSSEWISTLPKEVSFLQFVPDTLSFGERKGANFYQIEAMRNNEDGSSYHIVTTFSVRAKPSQEFFDEINHHVLENIKTQNPIIARLSSGRWIGIIICVNEELKQTQIEILDLHHGNQLFQTTIKSTISSNVIAVDSMQQNFSDVAYMGDANGYIWKLHFHDNWHLTCQRVLGVGKIHSLIVGKHPQGNGVVLYVVNDNPFDKHQELHALADVNNTIKPLFICKNPVSIEKFVLWQGYLIASDANNKINLYDAFTGEHQFEGALSEIKELENYQVIENQLPMIFIRKPIDDVPVFIINTKYGLLSGQFSIKNNRLGRHTWQIMS